MTYEHVVSGGPRSSAFSLTPFSHDGDQFDDCFVHPLRDQVPLMVGHAEK